MRGNVQYLLGDEATISNTRSKNNILEDQQKSSTKLTKTNRDLCVENCSYLLWDEETVTINGHIHTIRVTGANSLSLDVSRSLKRDKVSVKVHNIQCLSTFSYLHVVEYAGGESHHACHPQVTG